ncbi:hypothetical protein IQ269_22880 [Tychonema sp. LEGE 07199]|uniref:hypothetical protein n=1 Tax=unclassified Tychonema TaxID=2642144 RepID=UPI001882648A|nr:MULTISPECIES: hypothetical protein [unclassified Tychonema]MBE9123565.1 hypothetical protein [Tychonema sp. LEGE 07199]MBE9135094.1 hypothetical protein [Tychonema sp. LEGE 07196]
MADKSGTLNHSPNLGERRLYVPRYPSLGCDSMQKCKNAAMQELLRYGFLPCTGNPHPQSIFQNLNSGGQSNYGRPYS